MCLCTSVLVVLYIHVFMHQCTCSTVYIHVFVHQCTCSTVYIHVFVHQCTCSTVYIHVLVHQCTCSTVYYGMSQLSYCTQNSQLHSIIYTHNLEFHCFVSVQMRAICLTLKMS